MENNLFMVLFVSIQFQYDVNHCILDPSAILNETLFLLIIKRFLLFPSYFYFNSTTFGTKQNVTSIKVSIYLLSKST